jgi:hypothetical protein
MKPVSKSKAEKRKWRKRRALSRPTDSALYAKGLTPALEHDRFLLRLLGPLERFPQNARGWWVRQTEAHALEIFSRVAEKQGIFVGELIRRLREVDQLKQAVLLVAHDMLDADKVKPDVARILGRPVVVGDVRMLPEGTLEILENGAWVPKDREYVQAKSAACARFGLRL